MRGALLGYLPDRWPKWFDPEPLVWNQSSYGPFQRSARITTAGDIIAVPTPGHTPHHLSVIVSDGSTDIVLAGDASYLERTMLSGTIDGISADEAVAQSTLAEIRALCAQRPTIYLPAHDPQSANRLKERQTVAAAQQTKSIMAVGASEPKMHPAPANG